jgi:hypothetical protein
MIDGYSGTPFEEQRKLADHLQVSVTAPDGVAIVVDKGLKFLLLELWEKGYETRYSCQGGDKDNFYNLRPQDEASAEGYIFFTTEAMALSFFSVVDSIFPADKCSLYYIDSRAILRFAPQAILLMEYALAHYAGNPSFGSSDVVESLTYVKLPNETEAERRLNKLLPSV